MLLDGCYWNNDDSTACLRELSALQNGFRKNQSTMPAVILAHENAMFHPKLHSILLDILGAYDRTSISLLLEKLRRKGASEGLLSIISSLFLGCSTYIVVNGKLSRLIHMGRGLMQGSLLSPPLFNVFIDDLLEALLTIEPRLQWPISLGYADDLILQHMCKIVMQKMLHVTVEWNDTNGLCLNLKKCASLTPHTEATFDVGRGKIIPHMKSCSYLGFPLFRDGIHWDIHVETIAKKGRWMLDSTIRAVRWHTSEFSKMVIYKTFIRPIMEYGAGLLSVLDRKQKGRGQISLGPITAVEQSALIWIFGVGKFTQPLRAVADIPTPQHRFFTLQVRLRQQLLGQGEDSPFVQTLHRIQQMTIGGSPNTSVMTELMAGVDIEEGEFKIPIAIKQEKYITDAQIREYHHNNYIRSTKKDQRIMPKNDITHCQGKLQEGCRL